MRTSPFLTAIVSYDVNYGIAKNSIIPWDLPFDRSIFRQLTQGLVVLVGAKTFHTIKQPLHGRRLAVLGSKKDNVNSAKFFRNKDSFLDYYSDQSDIVVAGGQKVYDDFINETSTVIATEISKDFDCDKFFPRLDKSKWRKTVLFKDLVENGIKYGVVRYDRKGL